MKKRIFALFLALLMIVSMVACATDDSGKHPADTYTIAYEGLAILLEDRA